MRILITNVYSYKNKGDAAIVIALINEIQRVFPDAEIVAQTADINHDSDKYGVPITASLLWLLLSSVRNEGIFKRLWVPLRGLTSLVLYLWVYALSRRKASWLLTPKLREFMQANHEADFVITCGGGYLRTANGSLRETILAIVTCFNFLVAKYVGKKVYLYSQSIGPVHGRMQERILAFSLNRFDLVEAREDVSIRYLQKLAIQAPIVKTADPALLLGGKGVFPKKEVKLTPGRLHVGITVRKWFKTKAQLEAYELAVAKNIDYLIDQHNAEVFYIPQVIAENFGDDDRVVAREVKEKVTHKDRFTVVEADLHPFEVIGLCGSMDLFIGTRMHSNIFSLISGLPVVAIEYEHKTRGIMRGLGIEELTIDINDVNEQTLRDKIDLLMTKHDHFKALLKQNMPAQIEESRRAMDAIKEYYEAA